MLYLCPLLRAHCVSNEKDHQAVFYDLEKLCGVSCSGSAGIGKQELTHTAV